MYKCAINVPLEIYIQYIHDVNLLFSFRWQIDHLKENKVKLYWVKCAMTHNKETTCWICYQDKVSLQWNMNTLLHSLNQHFFQHNTNNGTYAFPLSRQQCWHWETIRYEIGVRKVQHTKTKQHVMSCVIGSSNHKYHCKAAIHKFPLSP